MVWITLLIIFGVAILVWGFVVSWKALIAGIKGPEFGFLQNLLSEGLGVVLTAAIIGPLTTYFVERRRRESLLPIRNRLIHSILEKSLEYSREGLYTFSNLGFKKLMLESAACDISTWRLQQTLSNLNRSIYEKAPETQPPPQELSEKLERAARDVAFIASSFRDRRLTIEEIRHLIEIHSPVISSEMISKLSEFSDYLGREIGAFRRLERYFLGYGSLSDRQLVLRAGLDSVMLSKQIEEVIGGEGSEEFSAALKQIEQTGVNRETQKGIIEAAVKVVDAIYYKAENDLGEH